jgi:hypothetical protein
MPLKSKAQMRLAYASAAGKAKDGMPTKVAKRYIEETPKKAFAKLPEKKDVPAKKMVLKRKGGK